MQSSQYFCCCGVLHAMVLHGSRIMPIRTEMGAMTLPTPQCGGLTLMLHVSLCWPGRLVCNRACALLAMIALAAKVQPRRRKL
jgi:hypothetical protein